MASDQFVHLHVHSTFSMLDGVPQPSDIAKHVAGLKQPAVAITDHGYMFGCYKHQQACNDAGIKAIHGVEAYYVDDIADRENRLMYHLILLAMNDIGWHNLVQINTLSGKDGFYYKPRTDIRMLSKYSEGIICLSGCYKSPVSYHFSAEGRDLDKARNNMLTLAGLFKDRFYNEVMHIEWPEYDSLVPEIVAMATELGIKTVATNDAHYLKSSDAEVQNTMLGISTGGFGEDGGLEFSAQSLYLKSREEMMVGNLTQSMLDMSIEIAERIQFKLAFSGYKFPSFDIKTSNGYESFSQYMKKCHGVQI